MTETLQQYTVTIRPAVAADVPAIHATLLALAEHIGARGDVASTPEVLMRDGFGDTPCFSVEIAEIDGAFAGLCIRFPIYSTWMGVPGVFVQDLYVEDRFRGRKVGEMLLRHVANLSKAAGGGYLRLSVDIDNPGARGFYDRLGIAHSDYEQTHKITGDAFDAFCEGRAPAMRARESE